MNDSSVKPKNQHRKFFLGLATAAVLIVVLLVAFFAFQDLAGRDPLLYNNAVTVQAVTYKTTCLRGENVTIMVYLINGKNEAVIYPSSVGYSVETSNGTEIYGFGQDISWAPPYPTFAPHIKTLFSSGSDKSVTFVWNQKDSNRTLVESGNYTIKVVVALYGTSECEIQIAS